MARGRGWQSDPHLCGAVGSSWSWGSLPTPASQQDRGIEKIKNSNKQRSWQPRAMPEERGERSRVQKFRVSMCYFLGIKIRMCRGSGTNFSEGQHCALIRV